VNRGRHEPSAPRACFRSTAFRTMSRTRSLRVTSRASSANTQGMTSNVFARLLSTGSQDDEAVVVDARGAALEEGRHERNLARG
jgi:hypothetical protein